MFNSAGSMYEEIEANRKKKKRKKKILIRRIIAIVLLLIIVAYLGILLNDIRRFHKGDHPLITTSVDIKEYDDGKVETYKSLGWVFRYYYRETINTQEIAPIWSKIQMDDILNRIVYDETLPEVETDYEIPDNFNKSSKVGSVLFFYDKNKNLLGTYACVLSKSDCEIATSAYLSEDKNDRNDYTQMSIIDDRYVFISEYKSRYTSVEEKVVYLYDIYAKHILAQYQDVRYAYLEYDDVNNAYTMIDSSKYMVKKDNYWGIDEVIKGQVRKYEDYVYKYINYDSNTKLYVFKNKNNGWIVYDANTKVYSSPIKEAISYIHYINGKMYIVAYTNNDDYLTKTYYLYNQDATNVLTKENIDDLVAYDNFLVYTKDNLLYVINYDGIEVISSIKLFFSDEESYTRVKPYSVIISTPKDQNATHFTIEYYYNLDDLTLIRVRDNVKETL